MPLKGKIQALLTLGINNNGLSSHTGVHYIGTGATGILRQPRSR